MVVAAVDALALEGVMEEVFRVRGRGFVGGGGGGEGEVACGGDGG